METDCDEQQKAIALVVEPMYLFAATFCVLKLGTTVAYLTILQ